MFYCPFLCPYIVLSSLTSMGKKKEKKKSEFWTLLSSEAVVQLVSQDLCGLGQFDIRLNPQRKGTCYCVEIPPPPTFSSKCFLYAAEC